MKKFLFIPILFLIAILEASLAPSFSFLGVSPNLVLVFLLILVILKRFEKVWWVIVLIGLFLDFFSGLPFGTISLSLILTSSIIDLINRSVFSGIKLWISISLVALGTLLYYLFLVILSRLLVSLGSGDSISYFCDFSSQCLFSSFSQLMVGIGYNLLVVILIFHGFKKIFHQE